MIILDENVMPNKKLFIFCLFCETEKEIYFVSHSNNGCNICSKN